MPASVGAPACGAQAESLRLQGTHSCKGQDTAEQFIENGKPWAQGVIRPHPKTQTREPPVQEE